MMYLDQLPWFLDLGVAIKLSESAIMSQRDSLPWLLFRLLSCESGLGRAFLRHAEWQIYFPAVTSEIGLLCKIYSVTF